MTRVYCNKCEKVLNFYPKRTDKGKIQYYETGSPHRCNHKLTKEYVKNNTVVIQWMLSDGRKLTPIRPIERKWQIEESEIVKND